jgi:amino acid transporter
MQVVLVIISLVLLGVIIHFLVSPKSSRLLRLSAIVALAFIGLAVGVCGVFLLRGPAEVETSIPLPFLIDAEPKPKTKTNVGVVVGYFATFAVIFALVAYSSRKERQKKDEPVKKAARSEAFQRVDETKLDLGPDTGDDESFDIGID